VMVYSPGGVVPLAPMVPPVVVMVRKAWPGGVTEPGLTAHRGVPLGCTGVTVQGTVSNDTGLLKVPVAATLRIAVEEPPGSTADGDKALDTVTVNCSPYAMDTEAAENRESNRAKTRARTTCLKFTMRG
jgi:hypothetical protein